MSTTNQRSPPSLPVHFVTHSYQPLAVSFVITKTTERWCRIHLSPSLPCRRRRAARSSACFSDGRSYIARRSVQGFSVNSCCIGRGYSNEEYQARHGIMLDRIRDRWNSVQTINVSKGLLDLPSQKGARTTPAWLHSALIAAFQRSTQSRAWSSPATRRRTADPQHLFHTGEPSAERCEGDCRAGDGSQYQGNENCSRTATTLPCNIAAFPSVDCDGIGSRWRTPAIAETSVLVLHPTVGVGIDCSTSQLTLRKIAIARGWLGSRSTLGARR